MIRQLPKIMVAPNGATRTKADHPRLPMTQTEILECAIECAAAGADGLHFHLREAGGNHVLDSDACAQFLPQLKQAMPSMIIQATSEAAGIYDPSEQIDFIQSCGAKFVSIGLREMERLQNEDALKTAYHDFHNKGIWVQHILYESKDLERLIDNHARGILPNIETVLFVCGRYSEQQNATPEDLEPFLATLAASQQHFDWAVCSFGKGETDVLNFAHQNGGKIRVGFENSIWHSDGTIASSNAARVTALIKRLSEQN